MPNGYCRSDDGKRSGNGGRSPCVPAPRAAPPRGGLKLISPELPADGHSGSHNALWSRAESSLGYGVRSKSNGFSSPPTTSRFRPEVSELAYFGGTSPDDSTVFTFPDIAAMYAE